MVRLQRLFFYGLLLLFVFGVNACKDKKSRALQKPRQETAIASYHSQAVKLYFKGTLLPLRTVPVLSPVDGIVKKLYFSYGSKVAKGDTLVALRATKLVDTFRSSVSDFLQKKAAMENQKARYDGDKELYNAHVLSRQDFMTSKDSYATSVLNFNQERLQLDKILQKLKITPQAIEGLELANTEAVVKLLQRSFAKIVVTAAEAGIVLIPVTTQAGPEHGSDAETSNNTNAELTVGTQVKAQQTMISLGSVAGYRVLVQVSELDIARISVGQKVLVTGDAFPGIVLNGVVRQVAVQADPSSHSQSGISLFSVIVDIPQVTPQAQAAIRIGMTAKVEISLVNPAAVSVPINAVINKKGKLFVTLIDAKGQQHEVEVVTGNTTNAEVAILKGVQVGDKVIVHHDGMV